jgi:hypothetical protein
VKPAPARVVVRKAPPAPRPMTNVEMYRGTEKEVKSF